MAVTSRDLHAAVHTPRRAVPAVALPSWSIDRRTLWLGALIVLAAIILNLVSGRGATWLDDLRYGRPRTMQLSTYVGHHEQAGQPTHFVGMNLNRRVVVMEIPGGDSSQTRMLQGPYLFGANEDLTPVTLSVADVNADTQPDLIVAVKNEQIIYINTGDSFRLIADSERQQLVGAAK